MRPFKICRYIVNNCAINEDTDIEPGGTSQSTSYDFLPKQQPLKSFSNRLVACNGDCGSKLSQIIDYCAHNKVELICAMLFLKLYQLSLPLLGYLAVEEC